MLPQQKLDALLARHGAVEAELASQLQTELFIKLSRELAELTPVVEKIKAYRAITAEIADLDAMISDSSLDSEMRAIAQSEKPALIDGLIGKTVPGVSVREK
ncbi:MAG: PCRF domain-containing protein, partial [Rhizomicrobium sp.]